MPPLSATQPKPKIRVAHVDVQLHIVRCLLRYVADFHEFEFTEDHDADYVFHSCDGLNVLKYSGVRIFITGENVTPNFAISDYAMAFEKLSFGDRYLWTPLFKMYGSYHELLQPKPDAASLLAKKTGFCAYVMSNTTDSDNAREEIFDLLCAYKTVNSGGLWRNNVGGRVEDKLAFQASHKFVIAFENCSYPGYLTEKFVDAALANAIPIYWGDPEIGKLFNSKAFINCHNYDSFEAVVQKVREIDQDDEHYLQMLAQPWFIDGKEPDCLKDQTFAAFLNHIFSQTPQAAYRRNRGRWGIKSEKHLYDMYHRPHLQIFKNLRKVWRKIYHKVIPHRKPRYHKNNMKFRNSTLYWRIKRTFRKSNIRHNGHSQYGQDVVAYELLGKPKSGGLFLDIGANDGVNLSNSLFFEKKGWKGICVEPHPVIFKSLQKERACHLENACIADKDGAVDFLVVNGASNMLSGINDFIDDRHRERIHSDIAENGGSTELIPINALSPSSLLRKYGFTSIDFLSIDTEGCELEILKNFNLKETAPRVISVENGSRSNSLFKYLTTQGYKLARCVGCDELYIHASI